MHLSIALIYHAVLATEWPISWQMTHSDTVTGSAGLSFLRGTDPVIATVMTAGLIIFPLF
jgi:hypothetical protein